jgi:hypothetical protein
VKVEFPEITKRMWIDEMEDRTGVEKIMTVFDLADCGLSHLAAKTATRVMLIYDRSENQKHFIILDNTMSQSLRASVSSWLEKNYEWNGVLPSA